MDWCATSRVLATLLSVHAFADPLTPGSDAPVCQNMLVPGGMRPCGRGEEPAELSAPATLLNHDARALPTAPAAPPGLPEQAAPASAVTEAEVDAYLASYGKPPREAVRAILDPSDEHIRDYGRALRRQAIVASYIGQRLALFQPEGAAAVKAARSAHTVLPYFLGMRIHVYVARGCTPCAGTVKVVKQLIEEQPAAQAQLFVVTDAGERGVLDALLRWDVSFPTHALTREQAVAQGVRKVPLVEVHDPRGHRSVRLVGVPNLAALRDQVIALRKVYLNQGRSDAAGMANANPVD
jgi:hypothetical protein